MPAYSFDATEVEPRVGFDPIPANKYMAVITDSEEKETKKGDGSYVQFTFEVIEGEYKGRKLWARLNLNNPNDQAVSIARAELSALCRAVNVLKLKDTTQLHDVPLTIKVTQKADPQTKEIRNEIRGYEPAALVKSPATPAKAPWKK